jgi:ATP-dependent DNA ligase
VKYDGYRLRLERDGDRVRLITKGGHNWTDRYPWIVEAALKNRHRQFVIDGEAVVLALTASPTSTRYTRAGTMTMCSCMPSTSWRWTATTCVGCRCRCARPTWRVYWLDGPTASLSRRSNRARSAPIIFRAACDMGLEGLVSKRRDRPYQAGRSKHWVKVKNRRHPAMSRVMESFG